MKTVKFITGNKNKLTEVQAILGGTVEIINEDYNIPEIQGSIEEVARQKCREAAIRANGPVLTEDTALRFHAMGGLPGPYVKSFLKYLGPEGLWKMLHAWEDKYATAVCTFAFSEGPGHDPLIFQGTVEGKIVEPRGGDAFGWDPIFEYQGETYAEMPKEKKNKLSHRSKALQAFRAYIEQQQKAEQGQE